jgi:hypothetical protein
MHAAFMKSNLKLGVERGKRLEPMHSTLINRQAVGGGSSGVKRQPAGSIFVFNFIS